MINPILKVVRGILRLRGNTDGTLIGNSGNKLLVDGSGVTQPISGTVAATQSGTWNVNNVSGTVSLPTGAATSALQSTGNTSVGSIDTKTPALGQAVMASSSPVVIASNQSAIPASQSGTWNITNVSGTVSLPTGASTAAKQPALGTAGIASADVISVQGIASMTALKVDGSAVTQPVSAASLPLPSGASTSALQTTGNTSLSSIDTKTPALGQALAASSVPVVLTAAQVTTLTPLSTVAATQSGTWNINNVSGTVSLPTGAATETSLAKLTQTQGSTTSGQSGNLNQGAVTTAAPSYTTAQTSPLSLTTSGALRTDRTSVAGTATSTGNGVVGAGVQRVAIASDNTAFTVNVGTSGLPTGAATEASLAKLTLAQASTTASQTGPLAQAEALNSAPTYVDGKTYPLNMTTGGALRTTRDWNLSSGSDSVTVNNQVGVNIYDSNGNNIQLGQNAMSSSLPVTLASDQTPVGIRFLDGSGAPTVGQQKMVDSSPIVIASDQTTIPVDANITGGTVSVGNTVATTNSTLDAVVGTKTPGTAATNSLLTGGVFNTTLPTLTNTQQASTQFDNRGRTIVAALPSAIGQTIMSGSTSVTIASDQSVIPANQTQVNGVAVSTGNGVVGTGVQRVAIASDNTAFSVNAVQSGTWNVTNVSGTVSLPTGASTSALQTTGNTSLSNIDTTTAKLTLAQASTTASQTGPLIQGAVTTSAPAYTTAKTSPLSLTTAGALRVDGSGVTQTVSGSVTAAITATSGDPINADVLGNLNVNVTTSVLPTGAATETSLAKLTKTQGSTTSGQSGPLIQGAVTTAAPSYTTAQTSPLSLTTGGALRTDETTIAGTAIATSNGVVSAGVQRVAIASDNTAFTVNAAQSGTWNVTNVSGTVSLPTGASTAANQTSVIGAKSASTAAASSMLVGAVYNSTLPINTDGLQSALQADARGRLVTVNPTQLPTSLGSQTTSASLCVALASDLANVPGNVKQLNGTTISTNSGTSDAGTQRIILASNQPSLSVDLQGIVGTEPDVGVATSGSGTLRVALSTDYQCGGTNRNDTYTLTGNGTTVSQCYKHFAMQVVGTGTAATSWTVVLEGSIDNVNFTTILSHSNVDGNGKMIWSAANHYPVNFWRSRCTAVVLGTATNIKAWIMGTT